MVLDSLPVDSFPLTSKLSGRRPGGLRRSPGLILSTHARHERPLTNTIQRLASIAGPVVVRINRDRGRVIRFPDQRRNVARSTAQ